MTHDPQETLSRVLGELGRLHVVVKRSRARQVTNADDRALLKSVAYAWFRSHRAVLKAGSTPDLERVDRPFQTILEASDRATRKTTYLAAIKEAIALVRALRPAYLLPMSAEPSAESPPDFTPLAADAAMRAILIGRWEECQRCLRSGAHLAATVMMGGLLEALFVARANAMTDKGPLFSAKAVPLDGRTLDTSSIH
jgi:hypothetical protein